MTFCKILVTGGTGLVGSALKELVASKSQDEEFYFASSTDADLTDLESTKELFKRVKPTCVVHLAAKVGGLYKNMREPLDFLEANMAMTINVMKCCLEYKCKLISCLSTCIFPDKPKQYPMTEDDIHQGPPHPSNYGYAYAKRMIDIYNKAYNQTHGLQFSSIIPTNVFGPDDQYNLKDAHVIPALIHQCYLAKKNGTPFTVLGSGKPLRQFIYSKDLAKILHWMIFEYKGTEPLIASPAQEISIEQVARTVVSAMHFKGPFQFDTTKADGQFKKTVSNMNLLSNMKDFQFTDFEVAINDSVAWFEANYESCRK